jgi:hypothetical protein
MAIRRRRRGGGGEKNHWIIFIYSQREKDFSCPKRRKKIKSDRSFYGLTIVGC